MKPNPIILTGGAGYIGSHTAKFLSHKGFYPIVLDDLRRGNQESVKWGPLEQVSLEDKAGVKQIFAKYKPLAVMHFAAYAYVGESVKNPGLYYQNNVAGSISLLQAMQEQGIKNLIFSSTCATYGNPQSLPLTEDHPQSPVNPYGKSKLMVEEIIKDFCAAGELKAVCLRYFNAAGADPDYQIGEMHHPETHIIPLALAALGNPSQPLSIFGKDYPTPDGTCVRDYIHVQDLAQAHWLALEYLQNGGESDAINLGNGNGFSILEILNVIERITGKKVPHQFQDRRSGDPAKLVGSNAKAREILQWSPEFPDLEKIIQTAWNWHQFRMEAV